MSLPVIIVQIELMEHLRIYVPQQHIGDKARAHVVENLGTSKAVKRRLAAVEAGKLRLIVSPIRGVEVNVVGTPRHLVETRSIAVHDAHIWRRIGTIILHSRDRCVSHDILNTVLNQIRRNLWVVQSSDARSHKVCWVEIRQVEGYYRVTGIRIQVLPSSRGNVNVGKNFVVNIVDLRSVGVAARIRFMQPVQRLWMIVGVTNPEKMRLIVLNIGS